MISVLFSVLMILNIGNLSLKTVTITMQRSLVEIDIEDEKLHHIYTSEYKLNVYLCIHAPYYLLLLLLLDIKLISNYKRTIKY